MRAHYTYGTSWTLRVNIARKAHPWRPVIPCWLLRSKGQHTTVRPRFRVWGLGFKHTTVRLRGQDTTSDKHGRHRMPKPSLQLNQALSPGPQVANLRGRRDERWNHIGQSDVGSFADFRGGAWGLGWSPRCKTFFKGEHRMSVGGGCALPKYL